MNNKIGTGLCGHTIRGRGCCYKCHTKLACLVKKDETSWEKLEQEGKVKLLPEGERYAAS